ncbi:hypothetical protein DFJ74DRAFT_767471 [Hyaloraphidium curvatum]|nr:hypothetical protein DFJ74DRAFT_767471 [Hyaloraphidium curvatum]
MAGASVEVLPDGQRIYSSPLPPIAEQKNAHIVDFLLHSDAPGAFPSLSPAQRMTPARLALPAFIDGPSGRTQTYADLRRDVDAFAKGLAAPGTPWGGADESTIVAVYSPNQLFYMTVLFGTLRAGGTVTTANPNYTADELASQLEDSGATIVVAGESAVAKAVKAMERVGLPTSNLLVLPDDATRPGLRGFAAEDFGPARAVSVHTVIASGAGVKDTFMDEETGKQVPILPPLKFAGPEDSKQKTAFIVYSSGTTGRSKGVMLSHYNIVNNCLQLDGLDGDTDYPTNGVRIIGVLPLYHIYGLVAVAQRPILRGATIVILPSYSLPAFCETVQRYGIQFVHIVPPQLLQLAKREEPSQYDLSTLRGVMCGAAPFSFETVNELRHRLGKPKLLVKNAWGMSELSPGGAGCYSDRPVPEGTIGVPLPSVQFRIVDPETLKDVPEGTDGELWARGPNVMHGYLNRPDATAETIVEGGWLRTGDIVRCEKGFFFITDRLKELIKFSGLQVAPADLEAVILTHPDVLDCAVIPLPHPESGEVPKAYAVAKPGKQAFDLAGWVAERVSPHKKLRGGVEWCEEIPKSPSGKILRRVLVDKEKERAEAVKAKL